MESYEEDAAAALAEVDRMRRINEQHLRRPRGYWVMVASLMALWVLSPVIYTALPEPYGYLLPVALVPLIALTLMWRRPRDMRARYTLDATMTQQIMSSIAAPVAGIWAVSSAAFGFLDWWWVPQVAAVVVFVTVYLRFQALDRQWARTVSNRD